MQSLSHQLPFSWLVYRDVEEGRNELNFSEWQNGRRKGEKPSEIREQITEGGMPPIEYGLVHPDARLTGDEKRQLVDGLTAKLFPCRSFQRQQPS